MLGEQTAHSPARVPAPRHRLGDSGGQGDGLKSPRSPFCDGMEGGLASPLP